jgi:carbamate kinase
VIPGTIVIALGGNALQPPGERVTIYDQFRHTRESLTAVVDLARDGWHIALVHGNGPQVRDALGATSTRDRRALPQGPRVGHGWVDWVHVQQSLQNALERADVPRPVLTAITQTEIVHGLSLDPVKPSVSAPRG